jgi:TolA-binding protein
MGGTGLAHAVNWLKATDNRQPWELALDLAKRSREPVMAFVHVEGLQLTDTMDNLTFADEAVTAATKAFLCVRVEVFEPESGPFLDRYNLRRVNAEPGEELTVRGGHAYPVTVFISPSGAAEHMVYGFLMADAFVKVTEQAAEVIKLRGKLEDNPDDAPALGRLGGLYVELQRYGAGRDVLQKAIALDPDNAAGVREGALLDLALTVMAAEEYPLAVELLTSHAAQFPESDSRCKAQFLLGGALLAGAEATQLQIEQLPPGDAAAAARERAQTSRQKAAEAWKWFEAEEGQEAPCPDTEWSRYSLGALGALRMEIDFRVAENIGEGGKPREAVQAVREFIKQYRGNEEIEGVAGRIYDAELLLGKYLMAAGQFAEAANHWRGFIDRYPPKVIDDRLARPEFADTCEASFLLGECLLKLGKREQALKQWRTLASEDKKNPCRPTRWPADAARALEEQER